MTTGNEPTKEKKEGRTKKNADLECVEERKKKQFKIESVKVSKNGEVGLEETEET